VIAAACGGGHEAVAPTKLKLVATPAVTKVQRLPDAVETTPQVVPRGGRAALQVAFAARRGVTIQASAQALHNAAGATLGPTAVSLLHAIDVKRASDAVPDGVGGLVPDVLMPLPAKATGLATQSLYVEVPVPRTAEPGRYAGVLTVDVGGERGTVPLTVDVARVALPAAHALRTWFLVWDDRAERMEDRPIRARYHALLRDEGLGDGTATSADLAVGVDVQSPRDGNALQVANRASSLLDRRPNAIPYSYEFDEPSDDAERAAAAAWGSELHATAPDVRQLVTAPPWPGLQPGQVGTFAVHLHDAAQAAPAAKALGAELWIYSSCCEEPGDPTMLLDDFASSNAAVAPATWLAGGRGFLYWGISAYMANPWRVANSDPTGVANGDGVLVYPGRPAGLDGPVPSLRLKLFALGLQLVDLAAIAEQRGAGAEARDVLESLMGPGHDGAAWEAAERRLVALAGG
jgi:hypothetical protein